MDRTYEFNEQFKIGLRGERFLDRFFGLFYSVTEATRDQQRIGIDRFLTSLYRDRDYLMSAPADGLPVEYKTDAIAHKTGNAFIETISVDTDDKGGWVSTSQSHFLIYYIPYSGQIFVWSIKELRARQEEWKRRYGVKPVSNNGYTTYGIPVPLNVLKARPIMCKAIQL